MSRLSKFWLVIATLIPLMACGSNEKELRLSTEKSGGDRTVVVYFSCTGHTQGIAQKIANTLNCMEWEVVAEEPYTAADLAYYTDCRADREQADDTARPGYVGEVDLSGCEVVYIGFPIWHGKLPKIMYTFLEANDMSGKTIIPFCTSGSSPISPAVAEIRALAPRSEVVDGLRFDSDASLDVVSSWVESVQPELSMNKTMINKIDITVNGRVLKATLVENSSTKALLELLQNGPLTIDMSDYASFEKVGQLPKSLPTNDTYITTQAGDLILYLGRCFVIYYDENSYSFTRLGKIDDISKAELKSVLGKGDVTVVLSLSNTSGVNHVVADSASEGLVFCPDGIRAMKNTKGVIIQNGKKRVRR